MKNRTKRSLVLLTALLLCVLMAASLISCNVSQSTGGTDSDGTNDNTPSAPVELKLEYRQVSGGVEVYATGKESLTERVEIPSTHDGYHVVGIAEKAFFGFSNLKEVVIADDSHIEYIGAQAFDQCSSLKSFVVPETVTSIGKYAFASSPKLEYLYIPVGVESIGEYFIRNCSTENLDVYCGIAARNGGWDSYFASNQNYNSGTHFDIWYGIRSVAVDAGFEAGIKLDDTVMIGDCYSNEPSIVIPSTIAEKTVTEIAGSAFHYMSGMISVTIPDTVKTIGAYAFHKCISLKSIELPEGVESIGNRAFSENPALEYVTVPNTVESFGEFVFIGCNTGEIDVYCASAIKPSSWSSYYASNKTTNSSVAFDFWWGTTAVELSEKSFEAGVKVDGTLIITHYKGNDLTLDIPETIGGKTVTEIGTEAFYERVQLVNVTLPDTVKTIGAYAFCKCISLKSVEIPEGVETVGNRAFSENPALEYVTVPDTVESFGEFVFIGCNTGKLDIYCEAAMKPSGWSSYYASNKTTNSSVAFDFWWGTGAVELSEEDFEMGIKTDGTLIITHYNGNAANLTVPTAVNGRSVSEIGAEAFYERTSIQSITLPDTLTKIGAYAFYKCVSLTEITLPTGVTSIGARAFSDCSALTSIYIPNTVETAGAFLFIGCNTTKLTVSCGAAEKPSGWDGQYGSNKTTSYGVHFTFVWGA